MTDRQEQVFLGVHLTAQRKAYYFAVLDSHLKVLALEQGFAEEVLGYASGETVAAAAINAPRKPNSGLMMREDIRNGYHPIPPEGRWMNLRKVEYDLHRHGVRIHRTPSSKEDCPRWMRKGFRLYEEMGRMGYLSQRDEAENARFYFETHAEAGFHNLIGMKVLDGESTEGCIQRQLILLNEGLLIRDPMEYFEEITRHRMIRGQFPFDKVYSLPKLNALLAAFTAWLACNQPERIQRMGDMEEGELLLPGKKNK